MSRHMVLLERDEWAAKVKAGEKDLPIRKGFYSEVKQVGEEEDRTLDFVISDESEDRDEDIISVDGWDFTNYMKNPVVLFAHNYHAPAVAMGNPRIEGKKVKSLTKFASPDEYAFADTLYKLYKGGYMRATSVGFLPREWTENRNSRGYNFLKQELLEYSLVPVPSNPNAIQEAAQKGIHIQPLLNWADEVYRAFGRDPLGLRGTTIGIKTSQIYVCKGVVPFQDLPLADRDRPWDGNAARQRIRRWASSDGSGDKDTIDWAKYRKAFVWYDAENSENFESYKLPIADVIEGELRAVWRGVVSAMAALLGARGGVDIPDADRRGAYNHLARYYRKFGEEPPEFDSVVLAMNTLYADLAEAMALLITRPKTIFETFWMGDFKWPVPDWTIEAILADEENRKKAIRRVADIKPKEAEEHAARLIKILRDIEDKLTFKPQDVAALIESTVSEVLKQYV